MRTFVNAGPLGPPPIGSMDAAHGPPRHWQQSSSEMAAVAAVVVLLAVLVAKVAVVVARLTSRRTSFAYVTFAQERALEQVLVTDCTHPKARTLTHHKAHKNPAGLRPADTSTGLVLNALKANIWSAGQAYQYCQIPAITTNHFDVDSFLSVWSYIYRDAAVQYDGVLRHMSRIGDFRTAYISPELCTAHGAEDSIYNIRDAYTALKLVCWLNSVERRRFSGPYEAKDCDEKFDFFLPRFFAVLRDPESAWEEWQDEYKEVVSGFDQLSCPPPEGQLPPVEHHPSLGLTILRVPEPTLHYYSLFSHAVDSDVVLCLYGEQRYELECKYTQFVNVHSRRVFPRLDLAPLARVLNHMEGGALPPSVRWASARFTDTGPILRLEDTAHPLSKAQRYGHPSQRPILASTVPPATMAALTVSFLEFGMQGLKPKRGGWSWDELHTLNARTNWQQWEDTVVAQWARGELQAGPAAALPYTASSSCDGRDDSAAGAAGVGPLSRQGSVGACRHGLPMNPGGFWQPSLSEPSNLMSADDLSALAGAVPARLAAGKWRLIYSSTRDGISLNTLYRNAAGKSPSLLVVRESGPRAHIFGAFAAEPWRVGPRFYGTGETFVFQLHPARVRFGWQRPRVPAAAGSGGHRTSTDHMHAPAASSGGELTLNNYFQFSTHEGLGVGGAGHFAIWLDNELLEGASHVCDTFGSPCLASKEEFHVAAVELWHL